MDYPVSRMQSCSELGYRPAKAERFENASNIPDNDRPTFSDGGLQKLLDRHGFKDIK